MILREHPSGARHSDARIQLGVISRRRHVFKPPQFRRRAASRLNAADGAPFSFTSPRWTRGRDPPQPAFSGAFV